MKLKFVAAAALLVLGSTGASAAATDWAAHGMVEVGISAPSPGSFLDTFLFEITPVPYTVSSTAVANNLGNGLIFNVVGGMYSVWSAGGDGVVCVRALSGSRCCRVLHVDRRDHRDAHGGGRTCFD